MNIPDHLSVSQIIKYLICPLSYRFHYIDGIETGTKSTSFALGTSFHAAAEALHKHMMNGGVRDPNVYRDVLGDALATEFGNFEVQCKDGESQDSLTKEGAALVDLYREYREAQPAEILTVEQRIERELVNIQTGETLDVPWIAFIDVLEKTDEGLVLIDLKTAKRSYNQADVDADLQLTAYSLLVLLETSKLPASLRIDALIRNKTPKLQRIETHRTESDVVRFWALAREVRAAIQSGHFFPSRGWQCPTCEFAEHCQQWGLQLKEESK